MVVLEIGNILWNAFKGTRSATEIVLSINGKSRFHQLATASFSTPTYIGWIMLWLTMNTDSLSDVVLKARVLTEQFPALSILRALLFLAIVRNN